MNGADKREVPITQVPQQQGWSRSESLAPWGQSLWGIFRSSFDYSLLSTDVGFDTVTSVGAVVLIKGKTLDRKWKYETHP